MIYHEYIMKNGYIIIIDYKFRYFYPLLFRKYNKFLNNKYHIFSVLLQKYETKQYIDTRTHEN